MDAIKNRYTNTAKIILIGFGIKSWILPEQNNWKYPAAVNVL